MMTSKLGTAVVVAIGALVAACSGSTKGGNVDDGVESSNDALSASCFAQISAPVGSDEWRKELDACIADAKAAAADAQGAAPPPDPQDDGAGDDPGAGGTACSSSIQCSNGACTCGAGPNKGQSCDGAATTGASSCSVRCQYCQ